MVYRFVNFITNLANGLYIFFFEGNTNGAHSWEERRGSEVNFPLLPSKVEEEKIPLITRVVGGIMLAIAMYCIVWIGLALEEARRMGML